MDEAVEASLGLEPVMPLLKLDMHSLLAVPMNGQDCLVLRGGIADAAF